MSPAIVYSAKNHYLCGSLNVRNCMRWHRPYLLGGKVGAKKGTFFVNTDGRGGRQEVTVTLYIIRNLTTMMTRGRHILSTPAIAQGERLCRGRRTSRAYGPWGLLSVVLMFGYYSVSIGSQQGIPVPAATRNYILTIQTGKGNIIGRVIAI
mgnify:FL=1